MSYPDVPGLLVLEITWTEGSIARTETYGPWCLDPAETWVLDPSDSHTKEIASFIQQWQELTGCEPQRLTLSIIQEPEAWAKAKEVAREAKGTA